MKTRTGVLRLIANPRLSNAAGQRVSPFQGRLAVVVDGLSASTSEIFAGALQSLGRARVFGDTTAGQALPATLFRLPNNDVLMLAVADFRGPHGERIEGRGVVPDVVKKINRADLIQGRDAAVESALQWIASGTH
jgi:carboxyl-terminal processing protease